MSRSREVLTHCRGSDATQLNTFFQNVQMFEKACRENIKAAGGGFQMLHNVVDGIRLSCYLVLSGCKDNTDLIPNIEELPACVIFWILSVKEANSLHDLVDKSSAATHTGGFVSLSTVASKARALLSPWCFFFSYQRLALL